MQSMIRFCAVHLLCAVLCGLGVAQEPVLPTGTATPPTQTNTLTLPRKTEIDFVLLESVSSATATKGQSVRLAVGNDVSVNGVVVIPKGTPAEGKVASVRRGIPGKRDGWIAVQATSVQLSDGKRLRLKKYPPGEDACGGDFGPCWFPLGLILLSPFIVTFYIANAINAPQHRHSSQTVPAGKQMMIEPCKQAGAHPPVSAYPARKIEIQIPKRQLAQPEDEIGGVIPGCDSSK